MEVEWVIVADAAEVVNNKLYLIGGGWETLTINSDLPVLHPCAIAAAFSVPWNEANQQHNVEIAIDDREGKRLAAIEGQVEVGRPPGIPLGHAQRVQMAIKLALPLERSGAYVITVSVEGQEMKRTTFNVVVSTSAARNAA